MTTSSSWGQASGFNPDLSGLKSLDTAHPTAEWVPRAHPFLIFARRNKLSQGLLGDIPEFTAATALADRADELLKHERQTTTADMVLPSRADEVTEEWIEADIQRRTAAATARQRAQSLRELSFHARQRGVEVLEDQATDLVQALDTKMQDFVARLTTQVNKLGDRVHSANDAITEDVARVWKAITDMNPEYIAIRGVQLALYQCDSLFFDKTAAGDGYAGVHPEAKVYLHRNVNTAAPRWRGYVDGRGQQHPPEVPWSDDPTEFLVWAIRANLGMWCPTPQQVTEQVNSLGPINGYREFQESKTGQSYRPERSTQMTTVPWMS